MNACNGHIYHLSDCVPSLEGREFVALDVAKERAFCGVGVVQKDIYARACDRDVGSKFNMRGWLAAEVNSSITNVESVFHWSNLSSIIFIAVSFISHGSIPNIVEVLCLVLFVGIMGIDCAKMAIECRRNAGHVSIMTEVLVFVSFFVFEVLFRFREPSRRGYAGRVPVVPGMIGILGHPSIMRRGVEAFRIHPQITQHNALETRKVALNRLADMNDAIRVGKILFRPADDGICVVLEYLLSVVVVEHDGSP